MNQNQKKQSDIRELDQELETFNPTWHNGEFLEVNSVRYEGGTPENQNQTHNSRREGMGPNTKRKPS